MLADHRPVSEHPPVSDERRTRIRALLGLDGPIRERRCPDCGTPLQPETDDGPIRIGWECPDGCGEVL